MNDRRSHMSCPCTSPCGDTISVNLIATYGELVTVPAGQQIWSESDASDVVLIVCEGMVGLLDTTVEPGRVLDVCTRGDVMGVEDVVLRRRRGSCATALGVCRTMRLSEAHLQNAVGCGGPRAHGVAALAARAARQASRRLQEVAFGSVAARAARLLLRLADRGDPSSIEGTFTALPLNWADVARQMSCRPETLSRALHSAQLTQAVRVEARGFTVLDLWALRRLAVPDEDAARAP